MKPPLLSATLPLDLEEQIAGAYRQLQGDSAVPLDVAVRSSATVDDLSDTVLKTILAILEQEHAKTREPSFHSLY